MQRPLVLALIAVVAPAEPDGAVAQSVAAVADEPAQLHPAESVLNRAARLDVRDVALNDALTELSRRSGVPVAFSPSRHSGKRAVTCSCKDRTVAQALDRLLIFTRYRYVELGGHVVVIPEQTEKARPGLDTFRSLRPAYAVSLPMTAYARQGVVAGRVTERDTGRPLAGARVQIYGTSLGGMTGDDGRFEIRDVPAGEVEVRVQLLGYLAGSQTVNVTSGATATLDFALDPNPVALDEVVVVGYGTTQRRDLTGSVASVTSTELQELSVTRADHAFMGRLSGVQVVGATGEPGQSPSIRIRGVGSISAGGEPLYVVDGFPVDNIETLNPNDIDRIDVLKDASAAAIYGSRGSNGVVLINTKRGDAGAPTVTYETFAGWQQVAKQPKMMNAMEQAEAYYQSIRNRNIDEGVDVSLPESDWLHKVPVTVMDVLDGRNTIQIEHLDNVFQVAPQWEHQVSARGGTEDVRYAVSGSYVSQDGIVIGNDYERFSLRANIDANLTQRLSIAVNVNPTFTTRNHIDTGGIIRGAMVVPQYIPMYEEDGSYAVFSGGLDAVVNQINPMGLLYEDEDRQRGIQLIGNITANYALRDDLTLNVNVGSSLANTKRTTFRPNLPVFEDRPATGSDRSAMDYDWLTEYTLEYSKDLGGHGLTGLAGFTAQKARLESNFLESDRYPNNHVSTLSATSGLLTDGSSNVSEWSMLSYLARANYSYDDRYYITASLRRDGSSRFGPENQWGVFPSIALSWRLSQEQFMQDVRFLDDLTLRTSYGVTGNNNIGDYTHYPVIDYLTHSFGGQAFGGYAPGRLPNPSLTWETQRSVNAAAEASLFNSRLRFAIEHFRSRNYDLLLNVNIPRTTGFGTTLVNIGEVKNHGWEFELNTVNVDRGRFRWLTDASLSTFRNEVVALGPSGDPIISGGNITMIGQPIGMFYGWLTDGIFMDQGELEAGPIWNPGARDESRVGDIRFVDVDGDGVITSNDRTIMGSPYPKFHYGVTNRLSYGDWSLSVFIQGVHGNEILDIERVQTFNLRTRFRHLALMNDYWRSEEEPGDGKTPRPNDTVTGNFRGSWSQVFLDDGSYLRVRNIVLGYTVPRPITDGLKLGSARLYLNLTDPFLFTKHVGWNPDVNNSANPLEPGRSSYNYPMARSIGLGVNVSF